MRLQETGYLSLLVIILGVSSKVFSPHELLILIRQLVPALPAPAIHHVLGLPRLVLVRALAQHRDLEAVEALAATLDNE